MAFSTRVKNPPATIHGTPCSVGEVIKKLSKPEAAAFEQMLTATRPHSDRWLWSEADIYDAVRDEGHEIGRQSINRHRSGKCRCARTAAS